MLIEIARDELALITAHYHRQIDAARAQIERAEVILRETSATDLAEQALLGFATPAEMTAEANEIIVAAEGRLAHYAKFF